MTIATATTAARQALRDKAAIAAHSLQLVSQDDTPLNAAQVLTVDAILQALSDALAQAGASTPLPETSAIVQNGTTSTVRNAGGSVLGTYTVAANAVTQLAIPATTALVTSGLQTVAAEGTGTKVTLTVAAGKISKIVLSA